MNFNDNFKLFNQEILDILGIEFSLAIRSHLASLLALNQSVQINDLDFFKLVKQPIQRLKKFLETYQVLDDNFSTVLTLFIAAINETAENPLNFEEKSIDAAISVFLKKEFYMLNDSECLILREALLLNSLKQKNFSLVNIIYESKNLIKDLVLIKNNFITIHNSVIIQKFVNNLVLKNNSNNRLVEKINNNRDSSIQNHQITNNSQTSTTHSLNKISAIIKNHQLDESQNFTSAYNDKIKKTSLGIKI